MTTPLISVLIDTFNHERYLEHAVTSVLDQDLERREVEVVIIDDGSTDGTPAVAQKFAPRVRYLRKENGGQATAFNVGIPEVRGEIVAFLDGDDWWAANKLRTVVEVLKGDERIAAVGHGIVEAYGDGRRHEIVPPSRRTMNLGDREGACRFRQSKAFLGTSRLTARRSALQRVLPVPPTLVFEADEFLFTMLAAVGEMVVLPEALTFYRLHENNLFQMQSRTAEKRRRKFRVLDELVRVLPPRLSALGVPPEAVDAVIQPIWVDAERIRLALDGGKPWETFRVERTAFRLAQPDARFAYRLLKSAFLGLGLVLPPRHFFQLRHWYATRNVGRVGRWLGRHATPRVVERWQEN